MILISEFISEDGLKRLGNSGLKIEYDPDLWKSPDRLEVLVSEAQALIVRNQTQVNSRLLEAAAHLRVVGRLGLGLDNIALEEARKRGVQVVWPRGANAVAVAEYVMAALLLLARNLGSASRHVAEGGWDRSSFGGFELQGKVLGLVGLGEIGIRVAHRAAAFGMRVLACDPARRSTDAGVEESGIKLVELQTLLGESDFVSLHTPLTSETLHLIDRTRLRSMRAGSYLINTARGGLVESAALAEVLRAGHLAGAVLDVVDPEPFPQRHPLRNVPNLWITPHVAGLTREAHQRVSEQLADEIILVLREKGVAVSC